MNNNLLQKLYLEAKVCLPLYKILSSLCFIFLFSVVRGISDVYEIGIALDAYMAIPAAVLCADALCSEYSGRSWEIFERSPRTVRRRTLLTRIIIQCVYLWLLSALGYALFFLQRPDNTLQASHSLLFLLFLGAVPVTILFWGTTAFTFSNLWGNSLAGIGTTLILWLYAYSTTGERILGDWNVFAFVFRDIRNPADMGWLWGKALALTLTLLMALLHPRRKTGKL